MCICIVYIASVYVCVREEKRRVKYCNISLLNYRSVVVELLIRCAACNLDFLKGKGMCLL